MDYLNIGSTPPDETCAQVGRPDYSRLSKIECQAYINQLRRVLGPEPDGARLATKSFEHDFGSYREVVCYYNTCEGYEYAIRCEGEGPTRWDEEAIEEIRAAGRGKNLDPQES